MIPSTLCALVAVLSSFVAVNGAVIQRDGTFTYLTPQPTAPWQGAGTTTTTATTPTTTATTTTSTTTSATTTQSSSTTSTRSTTPTSTSTTAMTTPCPQCPPTTTTTTTTPCPQCPPTTSTTVCPPVTTTPTSPPGTANCNGVQQWQASLAYTAGDRVIFNGQLFTARQWTFDNTPSTHPDQWSAGGTCAQPINNQANCSGVSAWQSTVAYTAGNRVTFNGHLWSAVQWTQSNTPGDTSGSWKDQGACA